MGEEHRAKRAEQNNNGGDADNVEAESHISTSSSDDDVKASIETETLNHERKRKRKNQASPSRSKGALTGDFAQNDSDDGDGAYQDTGEYSPDTDSVRLIRKRAKSTEKATTPKGTKVLNNNIPKKRYAILYERYDGEEYDSDERAHPVFKLNPIRLPEKSPPLRKGDGMVTLRFSRLLRHFRQQQAIHHSGLAQLAQDPSRRWTKRVDGTSTNPWAVRAVLKLYTTAESTWKSEGRGLACLVH